MHAAWRSRIVVLLCLLPFAKTWLPLMPEVSVDQQFDSLVARSQSVRYEFMVCVGMGTPSFTRRMLHLRGGSTEGTPFQQELGVASAEDVDFEEVPVLEGQSLQSQSYHVGLEVTPERSKRQRDGPDPQHDSGGTEGQKRLRSLEMNGSAVSREGPSLAGDAEVNQQEQLLPTVNISVVVNASANASLLEDSEEEMDEAKVRQLYRRLAKVTRKRAQCEERVEKLLEMSGSNIDAGGGGGDGGGGGGGEEEIDPKNWLRMTQRKIQRLKQEQHRLEQLLGLAPADELTVTWAECSVCGKERITTRLMDEAEDYVCGNDGTYANTKLGSAINCSYPEETDEEAENVPDEFLTVRESNEAAVEDLLLPLEMPGKGPRVVFGRGVERHSVHTPVGEYIMYGAPIAPTAQTVSPFAQEFVETGFGSSAHPTLARMWRHIGHVLQRPHTLEASLRADINAAAAAFLAESKNATKASSGPVTSGRLAGRWLTSTKAVAKNRAAAQTTSYPGPVKHILELIGRLCPQEASALFLDLIHASPSPLSDDHCLDILQRFGSIRRADCADVCFQAYLHGRNPKPPPAFFNAVIAAYARDRHTWNALGLADALHHLELMLKLGVRVQRDTLLLALEVCERACAGPDLVGLEEACDIPALAAGCGMEGERVEEVYEAALECCRAWMATRKPLACARVLRILERVEEEGLPPPSAHVMEGLLRASKSLAEALPIFARFASSVATYLASHQVDAAQRDDPSSEMAASSDSQVLHGEPVAGLGRAGESTQDHAWLSS